MATGGISKSLLGNHVSLQSIYQGLLWLRMRQTAEYNSLTRGLFFLHVTGSLERSRPGWCQAPWYRCPQHFLCLYSSVLSMEASFFLISDGITVIFQAGERRKAKGKRHLPDKSVPLVRKTDGFYTIVPSLHDHSVMLASPAGRYATWEKGHRVLSAYQRDWGTEGTRYLH